MAHLNKYKMDSYWIKNYLTKMFCIICFFGGLLMGIDEEELCSHDNPLVRFNVRQFGYENPLRVILLGMSQRNERNAWRIMRHGHEFRFKRIRSAEAPFIQFESYWYNLDTVLNRRSQISEDYYDFVSDFARRQIKYESAAEWIQHQHSHNLHIPNSQCQYERMYFKALIKTVRESHYDFSLRKITCLFYRNLSKSTFRYPPASRCFYLMTYAFYLKKSFEYQ